jgi:hypothetical protein
MPEHQDRKNTLTDADFRGLEDLITRKLQEHQCRFPEITSADMATVKMLADDFKIIKRSFLDKIVTLVLILVLIMAAFGREIKSWLSG